MSILKILYYQVWTAIVLPVRNTASAKDSLGVFNYYVLSVLVLLFRENKVARG